MKQSTDMERYFTKISNSTHVPEVEIENSLKRHRVSINMSDLPTDPGLRTPISCVEKKIMPP